MSEPVRQLLVGALLATAAVIGARALRLGVARELAVAALRAALQLAAVGVVVAVVFRHPPLGLLFAAVMVLTAAVTSGGRMAGVPGARRRAAVAIAVPSLVAVGLLVLTGAFAPTPQALVPAVGILVGGAMTATTLTGRRLVEGLRDGAGEVEARLSLGDDVRTATLPIVRRAVLAGVVPAIDQTRTVGLVTLPGTFVGLVLGGASPLEAARLQLVVLLALLAVELAAATLVSGSVVRAATEPGERLRELPEAA